MNTHFAYVADAPMTTTVSIGNAPSLLLHIFFMLAIGGCIIAWLWAFVETCNRGYWTWLLALIFMPFIGLPLYYWFGPETTRRAA